MRSLWCSVIISPPLTGLEAIIRPNRAGAHRVFPAGPYSRLIAPYQPSTEDSKKRAGTSYQGRPLWKQWRPLVEQVQHQSWLSQKKSRRITSVFSSSVSWCSSTHMIIWYDLRDKKGDQFLWHNKQTLPKAQRSRGLSSAYQSNSFRSYHKFNHKSWSNFIFRISI